MGYLVYLQAMIFTIEQLVKMEDYLRTEMPYADSNDICLGTTSRLNDHKMIIHPAGTNSAKALIMMV